MSLLDAHGAGPGRAPVNPERAMLEAYDMEW
jgi:hypothetical protein